MIDIENEVLNTVANALRAIYGDNISVYGETIEVPESFPCACLVMDDNSELPGNKTLTRQPEMASEIMFNANVYSNLTQGKIAQAKAIMDVIDGCMRKFGFRRSFCRPLTNLLDRTVYRITARYTRVIQNF